MLIMFYHSVIHGLDFFINYYKYIEFFWRGAGNRGQNGVPVVKITAGLASIAGFHMTSLKFKLQNY